MRQRRSASQKAILQRHAPTCGASQKTILHWHAPTARCITKTAIHRHAPTARCIAKTAEVRFNMLARGWLAYPRDTGGARNYRRRAVVEMPSPHRHRRGATALFRNPVRGAKRMRAGILRILLISRAGGTPLPMAGRLTQLAKIIFRDLYNRSSAVD